jgi:hypothetical protein
MRSGGTSQKREFVIPGCDTSTSALADENGAGPESILPAVMMDSGFARPPDTEAASVSGNPE